MISHQTSVNPTPPQPSGSVPPQPSSSTQGIGTASGSAPTQANRFVTMQMLPNNVDDALTQFFSHLLREEQPQEDTNTDPDPDDQDSEVGEAPRDTRSEAGSELESEQFYTAANNSDNDLAGDTHSEPETLIPASIPDDIANSPWGTPLRHCQPMLDKIYQDRVAAGRLPDWPFADFLEFEFVKWMVVNDISQTARDKLIKLPIMERCGLSFGSNYALNKLLDKLPSAGPQWTRIQRTITGTIKDANGKNLTEDIEIWVRDIIDVIQELIGNTTYGKKLVFVPQRVEVNGTRKIDEMWTADWWMRIQQQLPPGSTIIPIVLSSDSTQLTNFSGGKSAWPVYITLRNIPKSIRAKINSYSSLLLAYLPVPKFDCFPPSVRGDQKARLFHESMTQILEPLISAGKDGVEMNCGDGYVRHCYPLLAAYIADNPEQTLVAGCKRNLCHRCTVKHDERGNLPEFPAPPRIPDHTAVALEAHDFGHTSALFNEQGLKPFGKPFWADLPHANIFSALTPDILHQLHKGVFKDHLMEWCLLLIRSLYGSADKVDYRYKAMPEHSSLRHFTSGVTKLKQTTAHEHREMQKVFMAVVAGLVPEPVLPVVLAAIDFIHFAWFPSHTPETLDLLDDALNRFHEHKHIFIEYGVRDHFNINKLHAMCHYVEAIRELGALDAYNTETPERLHIEFAKRAYKATNRRDFFNQMTTYLERREKVNKFDVYLQSIYPEYAARDLDVEKDVVEEPSAPGWKIAKKSPFPLVPVALLPELYGVKWFKDIMSDYFWDFHQDQQTKIEDGDCLEIYPKATQVINDAFATDLVDRVHASPARPNGPTKPRFDTVLIRKGAAAELNQLTIPSYGIRPHYIGRVRLIFKLPPYFGIRETLVVVQTFKIPTYTQTNKRMGMFKVTRERYSRADGDRTYAELIVPLSHIRRSCHLVPHFGEANTTPIIDSRTHFDALEFYETFYLNSLLDLHSFRMLLS
ncbi:hypothetical protein FRC12_014116 [Ceratobasidium sp. 428]|nr:hypothetical protein FRC12_014116 [Ceratobasidium sp. 428]